jgi:hypothetical protein
MGFSEVCPFWLTRRDPTTAVRAGGPVGFRVPDGSAAATSSWVARAGQEAAMPALPAHPTEFDDADKSPDLSPPLQAAALAAITIGAALLILLARSF